MNKETEHAGLLKEIESCTACGLCQGRTNAVPGEGNLNARLMIIGEGPGANEDAEGRPFVGRAGKLLEQMLDSIDLTREQVYIANIVKCRPPQNRAPKEEESEMCLPFLLRQIELVNPDVILLMGATALNNYIDKKLKITKTRGQWLTRDGRPVMATFHPAALLRDPNKNPAAFKDMLAVDRKLKGK
ncbi:MAG: uracil-DNA glycosylase [Clostridia bacterium]|nr:uracil-DNA glycosylase [Clostridia bacterium]